MSIHKVTREVAGVPWEIETGRLALQAWGAVTFRMGDTMALVTVTGAGVREGMDFFPLVCDYEERLYAAGKIPGSFFKREGRPTQEGTITCRLMDRGIRPLFPKGYRNEVQIVGLSLSSDGQNQMDIAVMNGAAAALALSGLPIAGIPASVRVALIEGETVLFPTHDQCDDAELDLVVTGTREAITMIEAGGLEVPEETIAETVKVAHEEIGRVIDLIEELVAFTTPVPRPYEVNLPGDDAIEAAAAYAPGLIETLGIADKAEQREAFKSGLKAAAKELAPKFEGRESEIDDALDTAVKKALRKQILETGKRIDGRRLDEVRTLVAEVGLCPRTHGTGMFMRGPTQCLCVATLGMLGEGQRLDGLIEGDKKTFMHHYNMPPYASGEVRMMRGPNRRAIGHGALAERALLAVLPDPDEFPYTIRVVSEIMGSDGSTSMASTCAASLAMHDAGVPLLGHVAGMAMGVVYSPEKQAILSDIQAMEDFNGDMDFKVAGTREGVTAIQLDVKCLGLDAALLGTALIAARAGRMQILDVMEECMPEPRAELSPYAPRMLMVQIPTDKIGAVIGPGGKTIRAIEALGVSVDIEEDGRVFISSTDSDAGEAAVEMVRRLTHDAKIGETYDAKVTRLMSFGAFCELMPGKEGLLRVGDYAWERTSSISDVLEVGDELRVQIVEVDDQGRVNVSRKILIEKPDGYVEPPARDRDSRRSGPPSGRGGRSGGSGGSSGGGGGPRFREKR